MTRCAAIVGYDRRHQVEYRQQCQHSAVDMVRAVPLCGKHIKLIARRPITVISELCLGDPPRQPDVIDVRRK